MNPYKKLKKGIRKLTKTVKRHTPSEQKRKKEMKRLQNKRYYQRHKQEILKRSQEKRNKELKSKDHVSV